MDVLLTLKEEHQLKLIARGLQTNENLNYDRATVDSLVKKRFLATAGIAIKLTPKGREALRKL